MSASGSLRVRPATLDDSERALAVVRRSIRELCIDDHQRDAATLERWLANKTPEHFARWLAAPDSLLVVAELNGVVRGVGNVARSGKVHLCYVEPRFERRGIGLAILTALEAQARAWGLTELSLESTRNAQAFYARQGYRATGCTASAFGVLQCYSFVKLLPNS